MVWNSQQHIFYRDTSGNIWHVYWDPSSGRHAEQWSGPGPNGLGNYAEFFLRNITQGWSTQVRQVIGYGATSGVTAEWIMERPHYNSCGWSGCTSGYHNLADYGTVQMTYAEAGSPSYFSSHVCCDVNGTPITMTSDGTPSGTVLSSVSSPNNTTVNFTYHASY
jgi:Peptidase A4 family/Repeat of unknown function (DUF346)